VGKVDAGSPAERAGLKDGDKIVEVNGKNVASEDHRAVVTEIKADPTRVQLLVVDSAALDYYTSRGQTISSSMSNVQRIECPDSKNGPSIGKLERRRHHRSSFIGAGVSTSCLVGVVV
jgi:S1-C subfamily serine protease